MGWQEKHFLVVAFPSQGNISPALHLAKRLTAAAATSAVTISTAISAHRRMFVGSSGDGEVRKGCLTFSPFSWGEDDSPTTRYFLSPQAKLEASRNLSILITAFAARGRPVTSVLHHLLLPWAADVAGDHDVPAVAYWTQPAAVFCMYYHYFHGYAGLIASHSEEPSFSLVFPRLPAPVRVRDLPSHFTLAAEDRSYTVVAAFREAFKRLDGETASRPAVLLNTFDALEAEALMPIGNIDLVGVGPLMPPPSSPTTKGGGADMFEAADPEEYMGWLDGKEKGSVVYVSFGSLVVLTRRQAAEISLGLTECGRPFLWAAREVGGISLGPVDGKVIQWCEQVTVLQHSAVGCFVTHCGWNSTVEGLAAGVPMVALPQWGDQMANSVMVEGVWGAGVRASAAAGDAVVEAAELRRCVELVMGEGGKEIRRKAAEWKLKARKAVGESGSSSANLEAFLAKLDEREAGMQP